MATLALLGIPQLSYAQLTKVPREPVCDTIYEIILPLRPPQYNALQKWHVFTGQPGYSVFNALMKTETELMAIGTQQAVIKDASSTPKVSLWAHKVTDRGRPAGENIINLDRLRMISDAVMTKDGKIAVLGMHDRPDGGQMPTLHLFKDMMRDIKPLSSRVLAENDQQLTATDIVSLDDGTLMVATVATHTPRNKKGGQTGPLESFTRLFGLDTNGRILWQRDYRLGFNNRINKIVPLTDGLLAAVGESAVDGTQGSRAGWLVIMNRKGSIVWQKSYARGIDASLNDVVQTADGGLLVAGSSTPGDGGIISAWVMKLTATGQPEWQRFYVGHAEYKAFAVAHQPSGRFLVLLHGARSGKEAAARAHIRILSLSSYGDVLNDEAFSQGAGTAPHATLFTDNGDSYVAGSAQAAIAVKDTDLARQELMDGWILAVPSQPPYDDPCKPKPLFPR